jgi:hypothetical protein
MPRPFRLLVSAKIALQIATPSLAHESDVSKVARLEAQLSAQEARIGELESAVRALTAAQQGGAQTSTAVAGQPAVQSAARAPLPPPTSGAVAPVQSASAATLDAPRLAVSGDVRVRYEANSGDAAARDRHRAVLRARLRGSYTFNDWLSTGAQLTTGDPDDPNSTDITLGQFDDDLMVSLDQAYLRLKPGRFDVHLGKLPLPFVRTDLVWDGDVSPGGGSVVHTAKLGGATLRTAGLYFVIDEAANGPDSRMIGGQVAVSPPLPAGWQGQLAVGYYDYTLNSLLGADSGDFRTNRTTGTGDARRYLSDFNLLDAIGWLSYDGFGPKRQLRLSGNYVRNLGAEPNAQDGYEIDLAFGRLTQAGDWRGSYMYAEADPDAVLAAFSHDNTAFGSNYLQHGLTLEHALTSHLFLNATLYHYRPKLALDGLALDWRQRLRLNIMASF